MHLNCHLFEEACFIGEIDGGAVVTYMRVSAWHEFLLQMQLPYQELGKLWEAVRCDNTSFNVHSL